MLTKATIATISISSPAPAATPAEDQELALALLSGDPEALRKAEACALADTMPLSHIARILLLAAQSGREAVRAQDSSRGRIAASWEAALLGSGALDAQERIRRQGMGTARSTPVTVLPILTTPREENALVSVSDSIEGDGI